MWPFKNKTNKSNKEKLLIPEIGDKVIYQYGYSDYEGIIISEGARTFCVKLTKGGYIYQNGENMIIYKNSEILVLEKRKV